MSKAKTVYNSNILLCEWRKEEHRYTRLVHTNDEGTHVM